jgi:hypothetical protein
LTAVDIAIIAASSVTAGSGILYAGKRVWSALRMLERAAEMLFGEPNNPERPALDEWQRHVNGQLGTLVQYDVRLEAMEAQFRPNGGSSMRDKVDKIAASLGVEEDDKPARLPRQRRTG